MSMYRQQILLEKLFKFRFSKHGFDLIKVEVYDHFDGDSYKCRLEVFKGGTGIENRVMKYERKLDEHFVLKAENRLSLLLAEKNV